MKGGPNEVMVRRKAIRLNLSLKWDLIVDTWWSKANSTINNDLYYWDYKM